MTTTAGETTQALAPRAANGTSEVARAEPTAPPQFARGFEGMATEPFPDAIRKVLAEPVPPEAVEIKPDGIVYVPGVYYRRQLTRAFGPGGWALAPRQPARVMGDLVVYPGALYCLGRFVAEAVGECTYRQNSNMSYASCVEGAKTDALSRCCKDLGMATELWDAAWRDRWKAEYAERYMGEKWDAKAGRKVPKEMWRLRSGRPVQQIDLMSGAGGAAPEAPAPKDDGPAASVTATAPSAASNASSSSPSIAPAYDTGVPATDADKAAIRDAVKRLRWTAKYARLWLGRNAGGIDSVDALSALQATAVLAALETEEAKGKR